MPQDNDTSMISFAVTVKKDSNIATGRIVHVVIVKPKVASDAELIITPLLIIIPIAALLVMISSKIKKGKKTNEVLDELENVAAKIDNVKGLL